MVALLISLAGLAELAGLEWLPNYMIYGNIAKRDVFLGNICGGHFLKACINKHFGKNYKDANRIPAHARA